MVIYMKKLWYVFGLIFLISCSSEPEITLIHQVNGYTLTSNDTGVIKFDAIAIQEGKVLATGTETDLIAAYPGATLIDAQEKTMILD